MRFGQVSHSNLKETLRWSGTNASDEFNNLNKLSVVVHVEN